VYVGVNNSVCFHSYSHPDYPVQYHSINITITNHETDVVHSCTISQTLEDNTTCFALPADTCNNTGSCKTLSVLGIANNSLGNSEIAITGIEVAGMNEQV
jgi:hypothetical protein